MLATKFLGRLKTIRAAIALMVLVLVVVMFLDFGSLLPPALTSFLAAAQFIPALFHASTLAWSGILAALAVVLLTLFVGRVYCSTLCPLGTLQDLVIRFSTTRRRRRRFRYAVPRMAIHVALLAVTALFVSVGSMVLVVLLEPYSNFGRIVSELGRPVVGAGVNLVSGLLGAVHLYAIAPLQFPKVHPAVILGPLFFLALIVYLSYRHGRLFCNLLCPAGALLRLIARVSLFKLRIDENTCKHCGLCEKVCKANCIDADTMHLDFSACVSCFNCIDACPTVGLVYSGPGVKNAPPTPVDHSRRSAVKTVALLAGAAAGFPDSVVVSHQKPRPSRQPVTPPGSHDLRRFNTLCTACHLCVNVCPTQVLTPATLEYGISGLFQPRMEYASGACVYDCVACAQVCPTGAIALLPLDEKKLTQIGKATFVKEDCIVYTKKTDCGACSEHCPTKAVKMVPFEGKLTIPEVTEELCIGCGACEHPCPTRPQRAIYVEARPLHGVAKKPEQKKIENTLKDGEFPF